VFADGAPLYLRANRDGFQSGFTSIFQALYRRA
jgi:hypothetical protein